MSLKSGLNLAGGTNQCLALQLPMREMGYWHGGGCILLCAHCSVVTYCVTCVKFVFNWIR